MKRTMSSNNDCDTLVEEDCCIQSDYIWFKLKASIFSIKNLTGVDKTIDNYGRINNDLWLAYLLLQTLSINPESKFKWL